MNFLARVMPFLLCWAVVMSSPSVNVKLANPPIKVNLAEPKTKEGLGQSAFSIIQGENFDYTNGATTSTCGGTTRANHLWDGTILRYDNVDFGTGASTIIVQYSMDDSYIETPHVANIFIDNVDITGTQIATINTVHTASWCDVMEVSVPLTSIPIGIHPVYFLFTSGYTDSSVMELDWFTFKP